jgi:hypothetical protein
MNSKTDTCSSSFGARLHNRWNDFTGTRPGDMFATLLTIAVMFGAMFCCALVILLGMDGLQLILRPH